MRQLQIEHTRACFALLGVLWAISSVGCESCQGCGSGEPPLATLEAVQGEGVSRDFAAAQGDWSPASVGATFHLDDGLRTKAGDVAALRLFEDSLLTVQPETLIRFRAALPDGTQHIDVETGEAVLRASGQGLSLRTSIGMAVLKSGSQMRLVRDGEGIRYEVQIGLATFRSRGEEDVEIAAGQDFEIGMGTAIIRTQEPEPEPDPVEELPEPETLEDAADRSWGKPGLEVAGDMALSAGHTLIVHAPTVPVTVGVAVGERCPEAAVVQLSGPTARYYARGTVNFSLGVGARAYAVRCITGGKLQAASVAKGRVRVMRDSGTSRLPKKAPITTVEADGRTYNILYQNQLPGVVVRWPRAPDTKSFDVSVDGQVRKVSEPRIRFAPGDLADGKHTVSFAAEGRRSRDATIKVAFDNVAPKASLRGPEDRSFSVGDTVQVSGVALPGWKVSVDHGTIEMDAGHRFEGTVTTSAEHPNIVLRLTHPTRGTHVYMRRAKQSP